MPSAPMSWPAISQTVTGIVASTLTTVIVK
jgi:hypothetical protein